MPSKAELDYFDARGSELEALLSAASTAVMVHQPADIAEFLALHFGAVQLEQRRQRQRCVPSAASSFPLRDGNEHFQEAVRALREAGDGALDLVRDGQTSTDDEASEWTRGLQEAKAKAAKAGAAAAEAMAMEAEAMVAAAATRSAEEMAIRLQIPSLSLEQLQLACEDLGLITDGDVGDREALYARLLERADTISQVI